MPEPERRRLWLALAASAMLHTVLLTSVIPAARQHFEAATAPVQALINVAPRVAAVQVPAVAQGAPQLAAAAPSVGPRAEYRRRRSAPGVPPATPVTNSSTRRLSPAKSATPPTPATAASPASAELSADELRQYRVALAIAARRFNRYPPMARAGGWQGRVEVALTFTHWQPGPQVALSASSGHAALDEQALAMVEQAAANTPLPAGLKGRSFRVLLPIEFRLDGDR